MAKNTDPGAGERTGPVADIGNFFGRDFFVQLGQTPVVGEHQDTQISPAAPRELAKALDGFPPSDILLAYEHLNWPEHWLEFLSCSMSQGKSEIKTQVYQALAKVNAGQARKILEGKEIVIGVDDEQFRGLQSLKLASSCDLPPEYHFDLPRPIRFICNLLLFLTFCVIFYFLAVNSTGSGAVFIIFFLALFLSGMLLGLMRWIFGVLGTFPRVAATEKRVDLTPLGKDFLENDLRPSFAEYIREYKL